MILNTQYTVQQSTVHSHPHPWPEYEFWSTFFFSILGAKKKKPENKQTANFCKSAKISPGYMHSYLLCNLAKTNYITFIHDLSVKEDAMT